MTHLSQRAWLAVLAWVAVSAMPTVAASPFADPGDLRLRHDLALLNDRGLIDLPLTSWPVMWADVQVAVSSMNDAWMDVDSAVALRRVRNRLSLEVQTGFGALEYRLAGSDNSRRIRLFEDTPRANAEAEVSADYLGDRFAGRLRLALAANPLDDKSVRLDGTYLAGIFGNTVVSAGWQDKWWGPGVGGTLGLSTNARPIPGLLVQRNISSPFETPILRWLGRWTAQMTMGQVESDRAVPDHYLFGMRVNFKPLQRLEIGVSRTAQWGGEGREQSLDSFFNMLLGRDNEGSDGLDDSTEPGNQLAGFDFRWTVFQGKRPVNFYGQIMGEDEAGGFPSRYLGQFGADVTWPLGKRGATLQVRIEYSDTTCQFHENSRIFNCAYNNSQFPDGYRYRELPVGHSTDNDASQTLISGQYVGRSGDILSVVYRQAKLNRGGPPDRRNTLTSTGQNLDNIEVTYKREWLGGTVTVGAGHDRTEELVGGNTDNKFRAFVQWQQGKY